MIEVGSARLRPSTWQDSGPGDFEPPGRLRHEPRAPGGAGRVGIASESLGIAPEVRHEPEGRARREVAERGCRLRVGDRRRSQLQANDTLKSTGARVEVVGFLAGQLRRALSRSWRPESRIACGLT